ncbi:MAG: CBS domain-containing protein [Planctomycetes bacterium]|nr:CBS domain-containing protein [Planctomycetota bacterium]
MTENRDKPQHSELIECQIRSHPNPLSTSSRNWLEVGDIMTEDVATVCPGISVVAATKVMSDKHISCVIVSDNGDLSGIITETDLLKRAVANGNDFRKMKIEQVMSSPVCSLPRNLSVLDASRIMETENIRRLVVLEDERLVGIITQTDVVRALSSYSMWKNVEELMTSDVAAIASSVSVKEAAEVMASRDISCLVAMENNTIAGIFTERDLLKRVIALKRNPAETILKNVMSSPVLSAPSNYSVSSASKMMEKMKIRRLLVMDDQNLLGVVTQTDILKAIKGKLREEEENYFKLLNESRNCIYMVDLNNNTTYVNPALMDLLEVTDPEELINQPFLPERFWDNPEKRDYILEQLKKASVEVHDLTLRTTRGNKLFITLFSTRTKNIKGQTIGSQGVFYDITAKKELAILREMEQQLRSSEDLLRGTIESTADGILVVDEKGRLSHMNNRFVKIWNVPEEIYKQQNDQKLFEHIGCLLENSSVFLDKLQASCPDNQNSFDILHLKEGKILEVSSLPLIREEKFAGQVWSFHDITKQKRAEEALHKAHDELEVRVEQRTAELARANKILESEITERKNAEQALELLNKDLESTISELQRINTELQEFVYITAHDLKTPLRGIGTLADWLSTDYADKFDEQGQKQIMMLAERAKRAGKLVDSVLMYSSAGHDEEQNEHVDLNIVLPELIFEIEPPENIEITVENKLPVLICQKTHISQVFQSLLGNAIKHMDKEKGRVNVGCIEEEDVWKFSVADNGPGIDQKYYKKIFKMFQTLAPRGENDSTGIGLSVAKKLVKLNGGRIWIESNPGEGSTFFFTLPKAGVLQEVRPGTAS